MSFSRHLPRRWCSVFAAGLLLSATAVAQPPRIDQNGSSIDYRVSVEPRSETFVVSATLAGIAQDTIAFHFPIWGPGAYDIVNFGAYVYDFSARSSTGRELTVLRGDTNTFRIIGGDSKVTISYRVDDIEQAANSLWFGLSDIEPDFAFANTVALFGYPAGYKDIPYTVSYEIPVGWDIAIGLDPIGEKKNEFRARDYDELVDAPLQMGMFQKIEFTLKGKPHTITVTAPTPISQEELKELSQRTERIVKIISDFFDDMPYRRYIFQHYLVTPGQGDVSFGALEHRNSSSYRMPLFEGQSPADLLASVIAHEYWHLWSPKRIHVSELGPFDYQRPPRTKSLWFAEGLTEYYAQTLLSRFSLSTPRNRLMGLESMMKGNYGRPQSESLTSLSLRFSEAELTDAIEVYSKGPIVILLLDAAIRTQTANEKSLDDALHYFNEEYGKKGKTFGDDDIIPIIEHATGAKLAEFYSRYIDGVDPLPYDEYLPKMGLKIVAEQRKQRVLGAKVESINNETARSIWRITSLTPKGSAEAMGLRKGDTLLSLRYEGNDVPISELPSELLDYPLPARFTHLTMKRDGEELVVPITIIPTLVESRRLALDEHATSISMNIRKAIIGL